MMAFSSKLGQFLWRDVLWKIEEAEKIEIPQFFLKSLGTL